MSTMDRDLEPTERRRELLTRAARWAVPLAAVLVLLALLPGWLRPSLDRDRLRTALVERGAVEGAVSAGGLVVPAFESVLSSPVEARVVRLLKRPGDRVAVGEPVVELDLADLVLERERQRERLRQKESELERERLRLAEEQAAREGLGEGARLDQELAAYQLEQSRRLHAQGLLAEDALRQAEVTDRKARLERTRLAAAAESGRARSAATLAELASEVALLRSELAGGERQLELGTARAGRAGVVTWTVPQEGVTVGRGAPVARVADLSAFGVEATVSDVHAAALRPGLPARVELAGAALEGTVEAVFPTIEQGVARFRVALAEPSHPGLRNNLRVDVHVVTERRAGVLRLPRGPALQGGRQRLFVIEGDRAVRREIELGLAGPDHWEVRSGLAEGEEAILSDMTDYQNAPHVRVR
jgi:HlyD family secretion protein